MNRVSRANYLIPTFETNIPEVTIEHIKQNMSSLHYVTLVALALADKKNVGTYIIVKFDTAMALNMFVDYALSVWKTNKSIKTYLRSYKLDGKFVTNMDDIKFESNDTPPHSHLDFEKIDVIIDIESDSSNKWLFKLYRYGEPQCRTITLMMNE